MNYYNRHVGDYAKDTGHLSQGQIGAYDLLLDWYYANEKPLPIDLDDIYRIARVVDAQEKKNVNKVLKFFTQTPDGYIHKRVEAELEKMKVRREINTKIAHEREAKRAASKGNRVPFSPRRGNES